jgi:predicted lipoprotein with Yx(FWY)xxD motif
MEDKMKLKAIVAALAAAIALTTAVIPAGAASAATVKLGHTSAGGLLETGSGLTLYMFSRDSRNKDTCLQISGCPAAWPSLTVNGRPTAGAGVRASLLGTIRIGHGRRQLTYAGHPLYLFAGDPITGDTGYLGFSSFGGIWYGVGGAGQAVR